VGGVDEVGRGRVGRGVSGGRGGAAAGVHGEGRVPVWEQFQWCSVWMSATVGRNGDGGPIPKPSCIGIWKLCANPIWLSFF
jgi:hypothetical protein